MKLLICTQVIDKNHPILGFFHGWILHFSEHFSEVHIICLQKGEYDFPSNVYIYSLGKEDGENRIKYLWRFYKSFFHVFFRIKVDFVFYHMGAIYNVLGAPFYILRKLFGTKFYWWKTHGTVTPMVHIALWCCDRVYTAAAVSFPLPTKKKRVIGHAIATTDVFTKSTHTEPQLLFIGRVTPVKKIEVALEAIHLLKQKGIQVPMRIVGALPDQTYLEHLQTCITELGIDNLITITGPVTHNEIGKEIQAATLVINPSETGGIDKVVLEAMQYGVPVIALEKTYGAILNQFGLAVRTQDPVSYAFLIEKIINDTQWSDSLPEKLRDEVLKNHALSTLTQRIFDV